MTENTPPTDLAELPEDALVVVNPATGQIVAYEQARADALFDELATARQIREALDNFQATLETELARRADRLNARTVTLDGCDYKVNAPTMDIYSVDVLLGEAAALQARGDRDAAELLRSVISQPPPAPPPPPRVDKRAVNRLMKTDNRHVLAALARARRRVATKRTVILTARAVDSTAEEA